MTMTTSIAAAIAFGWAAGSAGAGSGGVVVFDDRGAFDDASQGLTNLDFEGLVEEDFVDYSINGLQLGGVDFQGFSPGLGPYLYVVDDGFFKPYYDWGSGDVLHGSFDGTITATLPAGTTAIGMDFMAFSDIAEEGEVCNFTFELSTGDVFTTDSFAYPNRAFIGFHSLGEDLTSITIRTTVDTEDHYFNVDNFTHGQVGLPCPADLDGSGDVDFEDILRILDAWGDKGGPEDIDDSGTVDFADLLIVLDAWGPCPA